jgi:hypothetical protein
MHISPILHVPFQYVCGAAANIRHKGDKIALWTTDAKLDDANRHIGMLFQDRLGLQMEMLRFELHRDASIRTSNFTNKKVASKEKIHGIPSVKDHTSSGFRKTNESMSTSKFEEAGKCLLCFIIF